MTDNKLARAAPTYLSGRREKILPAHGKEEINFLDPKISFFTAYAKGKRVLDLGCVNHNPENYRNKNWLHKAIANVASDCLGVDLYREGVDRLVREGYNVVFGDAEELSLGMSFDVVSAGDIIEHLGNPARFILSACRHMTNNAVLLISTPNPWYWRNFAKSVFSYDVRPNMEHTCWFCVTTLRQLLARFGLEIFDVRFTSQNYVEAKILPLPTYLRNTTINVACRRISVDDSPRQTDY